jgi:opacity protein-like surface antigen
MARIAARCLALAFACVGTSTPAHAQPAPPPPIVLDTPPAPELPPPDYARRPFELTAELLLGLPDCTVGSSYNERSESIAAGPGFGATVLWRPSPFFAFGGTVSALSFGFRPSAGSALAQGSADGHFWGLLGRVYFFDRGLLEPYLELGIGSAGVATRAREADAAYQESSAGLAVRAGGGIELYLSRHLRLGPAYDWTRFDVQQMRRCGQGRCADLDHARYGHGVGFSSVSLRLSVLLGPGW